MRQAWACFALAMLLAACTGKTQTMGGSWAGRPTAPENFRREFQLPIEFKNDGDAGTTQAPAPRIADRPDSPTRAVSAPSSH